MFTMIESVQSVAMPVTQSQNFVSGGFDHARDIANPLHHIPFVGQLYRAISGDEIAPAATLTGGFLYSGPLGALGASASLIIGGIFGDNNHDDIARTFSAYGTNAGGDTPRHPRIDISDPWRFNN